VIVKPDDVFVNEVIDSAVKPEAPKRVYRSVEEKRCIVEATFAPGTSIARVAREHGVNSNQVFQWRYEYRKGILGGRLKPEPKLLPVVVAEPEVAISVPAVAPQSNSSGTIRVELPGGVSVHVKSGIDPQLVRIVLETLRP
jgi:transposase